MRACSIFELFCWLALSRLSYRLLILRSNNLKYLKLCIRSIKRNSKFDNEIIPHVNIGDDGTIEFLKEQNITFTHTNYNAGICKGMNLAAQKSSFNYILYAHD